MDLKTAATIYDDLCREVYCILGIPIDAIEMPGVLQRIDAAALTAAPYLISTPNLNFLVTSQTDPQFRDSLLLSDLCPPDGMPIIWIARLLGVPIKRRTAGSDMFEALKARTGLERPLKIFLFGGTEPIAAEVARRLNSTTSGLKCVGWLCPGFVDVDELSEDHFIDQINASQCRLFDGCLGCQEMVSYGYSETILACKFPSGLTWVQQSISRPDPLSERLV